MAIAPNLSFASAIFKFFTVKPPSSFTAVCSQVKKLLEEGHKFFARSARKLLFTIEILIL